MNKNKKLSLWETVSLAVGTMIGAGIFSILGVGASICGNNLPIAFFLAGLISFSVAYSYSKLGCKFISNAGPIEFILRAIGHNIITGTLSILMWFSYVISIALFTKAFAGYFLALFNIPVFPIFLGFIETIVIIFFTVLNFFGSKAVGKSEFWIVFIKVSILLVFVVFGIWTIDPQLIKPSFENYNIDDVFFASSVLFLTYMGFGLITNASENIENPEKNIPLAIYISITIVGIIYILVSIVAIGNLGIEKLIQYKEYALAEASKPFLGEFGFVLVALGAVFSTSSAINATLYGGANISYVLAKKGELPKIFERKVWFGEPEGLYITSLISLIFALFFNLEIISSLISFVFLIIYIFVIFSHLKLTLQNKVSGNKHIILINLFVIVSVFITLIIYQLKDQKQSLYISIFILILAVIFEFILRNIFTRRILKRN